MLTLAQITDDRADVYSDLYKDVYGSRPRNVVFASREAFNEEWDYLVGALERNQEREAQELGLTIADEGGWEEFHQKKRNFTMYDYHKHRRLKLERQYKELVTS